MYSINEYTRAMIPRPNIFTIHTDTFLSECCICVLECAVQLLIDMKLSHTCEKFMLPAVHRNAGELEPRENDTGMVES